MCCDAEGRRPYLRCGARLEVRGFRTLYNDNRISALVLENYF